MKAAVAAAALAVLFAAAAPCSAQQVVAVLSSTSGPYQAAYDAFVRALGRKVPVFRLPGGLPAGSRARVVVAFGGEASVQSYSEKAVLIACLAPGLSGRLPHEGAFVFVTMKPPPGALLAQLRRLQPGLKRLGILSNPRDAKSYVAEITSEAAALGIEILAAEVTAPEGVPDALRALLAKKADALWLAPDPSLVTPETFQTIKQFSWDNSVPFYAPTAGLAAAGAAGAVSVDADSAGSQAAELARRALTGAELPEFVYPTKTELTVNIPAALKAGLTINPEALTKADRVIR